jgi:cell division protein ZapE
MHPAERYRALVAEGKLTGDPAQEQVALALDELAQALDGYKPGRKSLFGLGKPQTPPRGLYIYGPVGRGKSMLMDLFFAASAFEPRQRLHFHDFMARVHAQAKRRRDEDAADPIRRVAEGIREGAALLCFDEFQVGDIADAMILGRLFAALFEQGVVVVATSNRHPRELYENGINRQLFLPAIDLIESRMEVLLLDGPIDYRLARLERASVYFTPLGREADAALDRVWRDLTGLARGAPGALSVLGRSLAVPEQAKGVARFSFDALCASALGPPDYLALADAFHALFVTDVPQLAAARRDEARRLLTLIDALYERGVKLICSAEVLPHALYRQGDGAREFQRAASRLAEMQTAQYLARPHRPRTEAAWTD